MGGSLTQYYTPLTFTGVARTTQNKITVKNPDGSTVTKNEIRQKLYEAEKFSSPGITLGIGRDLKIAEHFFINFMAEGFYYFKSYHVKENPSKDVAIPISETKNSFNFLGGIVSVSPGVSFFIKKIKIQPYLKLGYGLGKATLHNNYFFNNYGARVPAPYDEKYDVKLSENVNITQLGLGTNLILPNGLFSYAEILYSAYSRSMNDISGVIKPNNAPAQQCNAMNCGLNYHNDATGFLTLTLGMGYRF